MITLGANISLALVIAFLSASIFFLVITHSKEVIKCTNMVNDLERKYYDKQMDCAVLTWELNRLVDLGAETSLIKDKKTGAYQSPPKPINPHK